MFEVYDNRGKTADRYTIYVWEFEGKHGGYSPDYCITTDGDPNDPRGIWLRGEFTERAVGLGEVRIEVEDLPVSAQLQLLQELQLEPDWRNEI